jgi:hypothetical protein
MGYRLVYMGSPDTTKFATAAGYGRSLTPGCADFERPDLSEANYIFARSDIYTESAATHLRLEAVNLCID